MGIFSDAQFVINEKRKMYSELSNLYPLFFSSKTLMVGQFGDFQGLKSIPTLLL